MRKIPSLKLNFQEAPQSDLIKALQSDKFQVSRVCEQKKFFEKRKRYK